jgi:hypothetical protein
MNDSNSFNGQTNDYNSYSVPNKNVAIVTTGLAFNISESNATISGRINSIGFSEISIFGHCWSSKPHPTIDDGVKNLGSTITAGTFSSNLIGLLPNTTYYVRAFASNSHGTSYGNQVLFKTKASLCGYFDCESLLGFNTHVEKLSTSSSASWDLGRGYLGKGFELNGNNLGGYIEFSINFSNTTKMTFWTKSINPGYPSRTPVVTVDGVISKTSLINGSSHFTNWMKLETDNILSGNHTIRINFTRITTYYVYYIDEIEFWSQNN